ncbi:hypothetical protein [Rehaibacterium terrae]|jgi:hypothetical protein|uniref:Roadblock/LC7 domain-containing protein n=1 Tax=Rehaibacterium terrae TaxID=1341696 RepID=A0A7W7XZ25_9GAMM|nr:hypothetical protein [Rehaibacterium terrae]MBB5015070.1 hypothetical protein [Rehaibacterium terrae]
MDANALIDRLFALSSQIRYVAVRAADGVTMRERAGIADASASESDRYEELLVNPTLLTLVRQRGDIDCGGMRYVLIRYGRFFQFVRPLRDGHVSVAIEADADVLALAGDLDALLDAPL